MERRGEGLTSYTVASRQQPRHPKLGFKRVKPSVGTLAICASKLQYYGRCMTATERHTQLGKRFIELSEQCHKQINSDAVGWWKDEVRV